MAGHVFISHGSENSDDAGAIAALLEARGVRTWIAPRDVRPGTDYSEELQKAIEACIAFVVLVSETSNTSPYVRAETEMAFSTEKPIFPVRRSDIKPAAGLAFFLKIRHWTDAYGPGGDAAMERLARELEALSGIEPQAAAAAPPPPASPRTPAPVDEARLRAAIGPKADFYLGKWAEMDAKRTQISWNWPACLLSIYWFAYRKMWTWLIACGLVYVMLSLLGSIEPALSKITFLLSIGITFITGGFGNQLYRNQVRALTADPALDPAALAKRGGVSKPAVFGAAGATIALLVVSAVILIRTMPLPVPPPPPGPTPDPNVVVLDRDFLVGRWSDDGNCASTSEFFADGRWTAANGGTGNWSLVGNQLVVTGPSGAASVQVTAVDRNVMALQTPDGTTGRSTRC
jgi:hypothetical protein